MLAAGLKAQSLDEGKKMYRYECYKKAIDMLTPLAANDPRANYYIGLSQIGLYHEEEGTLDAAQATFAKYPEDPANMAGTARIAFEKKNPTQGMQIANAVADKAKRKDWEPLLFAADAIVYTDGGNYQQAIDWLKKALESKDANDNADIHLSMGDAYQKIQGGGGEAMNNYEHIVDKDTKNSLAYARIGKLWYDAKNYQLALDNFNKAKEADPENPLPYKDLGYAYFWSGKYDLAKQNMQRYLDLACNVKDAEDRMLEILYLSKDYAGAVQKANEMLAKGKKNCNIYGIKGFSELETGDTVASLNDLKTYFNCPPKRIAPIDYTKYGKAFLFNSQYDSADTYFNKAIQIDTAKDKSDTYRQIAEAFKDRKEYLKSAQWYKRLVEEYPETQPLDYFWDVVMFYYAKDYDDAAKEGERYAQKHPEQPSAVYWQGRVAAAQDPEAKECLAGPFFSKWLDMIPDQEKAEKKNDTKLAYEYLLLCNYNKKDKEAEQKYKDLLRAIDPEDGLLKQIEDVEKAAKGKK